MLDRIPNYPADLNAMHEAVKAMTQEQNAQYRINLARMFCGASGYEWDDGFTHAIDATAIQRAEAFCRTVYPERFK